MNAAMLLGLVAAQWDWQARPPPPLPAPPIVSHLLFEAPLLLAAGLIAAAIFAAFLFHRAGRPGSAAITASALVAAAAGALLLAARVHTPREQVADATRALVEAVASVDEPGLRRWLSDDARLFASARLPEVGVPPDGLDRDGIIRQVRLLLGGRYRLREHAVAELQSAILGPGTARSQLRVRVVPEGDAVATNSYWCLTWRLEPDGGWRCYDLAPWSIDGVGSTAP